jgi:multiple sugar transport system permease protein
MAPDNNVPARRQPASPLSALLSKMRYEIKRSNKWAYVFIAPLMLDFLVFTVYMVFRVTTLAFQELYYGQTEWIGLKHFEYILHDAQFWNAMKNTVIYTIATVPGGIFLALILSEFIYRRSQIVQVFYKSTYYLPSVVSTAVLAIVWTWIYNPFYGILNYLLSLFGAESVNWLRDPKMAMFSVIVMSVISGVGVSVVFLTAAMGSLPTELYDAAKIDGAGEWTRFLRVTVPLLRPTLLYLFVVGFIGNFQVFEQIYIMTQGGPGFPGATETVGYLIYSLAFNSMNIGLAAAQSIILFVAILLFSVMQFRVFASEVEY